MQIAVVVATILFFSVAVISVDAATVNFVNRCRHAVSVVKTANGIAPALECNLGAGQRCSRTYASGGMNFKNGWQGLTLAEFTFNPWKNLDFYDLSVIVGYDIAMQISPSTGGPTVTCRAARCPEAYLFPKDDTKTKGTRAGGAFQVTFCP